MRYTLQKGPWTSTEKMLKDKGIYIYNVHNVHKGMSSTNQTCVNEGSGCYRDMATSRLTSRRNRTGSNLAWSCICSSRWGVL